MELPLLLLAALAGWFWLDSLHKRDRAVAAGRSAAERYGLQFLDETVAIARIWLARDARGRLRVQRIYGFEVSDTGADRLSCSVTLLGDRVTDIHIPPHRDDLAPVYRLYH